MWLNATTPTQFNLNLAFITHYKSSSMFQWEKGY